jgi:Na+-driven multidrug efflux pump
LTLIPLSALEFVFVGALRGTGNNKIPLVTSVIINLLNLGISFVLVRGLLFSSIGLIGSAIGVSTARFIGMGFIIYYTFTRNEIFKDAKFTLKITKTFVNKLVKLGVPTIFEQLIMSGGFMLLAALLTKLSTQQQAAYNISTNLNSMVWAPSIGLSVTVTAFISKTVGENSDPRPVVRESYILMFWLSVIQGVVFWLLAPSLVRSFSDVPEIVSYGTFCARAFSILAPALSCSLVEAGILRGAGRAAYVTVSSFTALWLGRIIAVWVLLYWFGMQISAVFAGVFLDFGSRTFLYYLKIRKKDCFISDL